MRFLTVLVSAGPLWGFFDQSEANSRDRGGVQDADDGRRDGLLPSQSTLGESLGPPAELQEPLCLHLI